MIEFNQTKFIRIVRDFMAKNSISHREFAKLAESSPMTLYRAAKGEFKLKISTILKMEKAMAKYMADLE